jgi:hypothetical protein
VSGLLLEMIEEVLLGWELRAWIPLNRQLPGRQSCLVLSLSHDTNKILTDNDLHEARNTPDRLFVYMDKRCSHLRGPHDSPMQHPRDPNMVNEFELASH